VESLVDAPHEKAQRRERWKANAVRVSDLCQLPSIDREMEAMSDAKLSSKERLYDEAFSLLQRAQALLERAQKRHTELEAMNTALIKGIASLDSSPDEPCALQRHKAGDLYANVDVYVAVEVDACTGPPPDADAALDRAYYNGAKQALAMANDSIEAANKWLADGCGGRRTASTKGGEL
jgi:hypothetical protein